MFMRTYEQGAQYCYNFLYVSLFLSTSVFSYNSMKLFYFHLREMPRVAIAALYVSYVYLVAQVWMLKVSLFRLMFDYLKQHEIIDVMDGDRGRSNVQTRQNRGWLKLNNLVDLWFSWLLA